MTPAPDAVVTWPKLPAAGEAPAPDDDPVVLSFGEPAWGADLGVEAGRERHLAHHRPAWLLPLVFVGMALAVALTALAMVTAREGAAAPEPAGRPPALAGLPPAGPRS